MTPTPLLSVLDPETLAETNRAMFGETPIRVVFAPASTRSCRTASPVTSPSSAPSSFVTASVAPGRWRVFLSVSGPAAPCSTLRGEAFVANNETNDVSVLEGRDGDFAAVDRFETGTHPDGITYLSR